MEKKKNKKKRRRGRRKEDDEEEEIGNGGVDWIGLALGRNWWRAVVNRIITEYDIQRTVHRDIF
jgi:hypothetical protein